MRAIAPAIIISKSQFNPPAPIFCFCIECGYISPGCLPSEEVFFEGLGVFLFLSPPAPFFYFNFFSFFFFFFFLGHPQHDGKKWKQLRKPRKSTKRITGLSQPYTGQIAAVAHALCASPINVAA
jgi:hypothetical protein